MNMRPFEFYTYVNRRDDLRPFHILPSSPSLFHPWLFRAQHLYHCQYHQRIVFIVCCLGRNIFLRRKRLVLQRFAAAFSIPFASPHLPVNDYVTILSVGHKGCYISVSVALAFLYVCFLFLSAYIYFEIINEHCAYGGLVQNRMDVRPSRVDERGEVLSLQYNVHFCRSIIFPKCLLCGS